MDEQKTVPEAHRYTFWEHIGELRTYILIGGGIFVGVAILIFPYEEEFITPYLLSPLDGETLIFLSPFDPLLFKLKIAFYFSFLLSFPLWLFLFFKFVSPALPSGKRLLLVFFGVFSFLLGLGALAVTYFYFVPITLSVLRSFIIPGAAFSLTANGYLSFILLELAVVFFISQLPVVISAFAYVGLINPYSLARQRRFLYLGLVVILAFLTPTTDIFTLLIVTIPAILLAELGISLAKLLTHRRYTDLHGQ